MVHGLLHHRFVISAAHPPFYAMLNKAYVSKKERVKIAEEQGDYQTIIRMHERPYRLEAFIEIIESGAELESQEYWNLVRTIWTDSENIHQCFHDWLTIWDYPDDRHLVMNEAERAVLASLPDDIEIYRGVRHMECARGLSWSTDKARATWFARRWSGGQEAILATGRVKKADVLAYFDGRNESEVVVNPDSVLDFGTQKL